MPDDPERRHARRQALRFRSRRPRDDLHPDRRPPQQRQRRKRLRPRLVDLRKAREGAIIPGTCGHGGAYATNMEIDPDKKIVTVFMVQHAGFPGSDAAKINQAVKKGVGAFLKAGEAEKP